MQLIKCTRNIKILRSWFCLGWLSHPREASVVIWFPKDLIWWTYMCSTSFNGGLFAVVCGAVCTFKIMVLKHSQKHRDNLWKLPVKKHVSSCSKCMDCNLPRRLFCFGCSSQHYSMPLPSAGALWLPLCCGRTQMAATSKQDRSKFKLFVCVQTTFYRGLFLMSPTVQSDSYWQILLDDYMFLVENNEVLLRMCHIKYHCHRSGRNERIGTTRSWWCCKACRKNTWLIVGKGRRNQSTTGWGHFKSTVGLFC